MLVGFFALDEEAFGTFTTDEGAPDADPTFFVHNVNEDNIVSANGTATAFDTDNLTNAYRWGVQLDNNFTRGQVYTVTCRYEIDSVVKQQTFSFNVV